MRTSYTERSRRPALCAVPGRGVAAPLGSRRGQSLIVAVIVMFVLLFVGGIFVGLVARNLLNTGRTRETVSSQQFAEAGITYCNNALQYSPDGADWRPAPTPAANPNDPDRRWLDDGFTRIDLNTGRALVRVSMHPAPNQPVGRYIRIESVGRSGHLDANDPTTFLNSPPPRLRRELLAYKAIGLTDYLRFVTNRFNDSRAVAEFGVPPIGQPLWLQFGGLPVRAASALPFPTPGAPMRINSALHLGHNVEIALDPRNNESLLVAGAIRPDAEVAANPTTVGARFNNLLTNPANAAPGALPLILPSDNANFTTFGGLVRDDGPNPDTQGYARLISKLDPPLLSATDPSTSVTRYRMLTRDSGRVFTDRNGNTFNTGRIGLGAGIYIDNFASIERESTAVSGGKSLRSVWLQPGSNTDWHGPFYIPRGAFIEFGYQLVQTRDAGGNLTGQYAPVPGFRIVRDDRQNRTPLDQMWNAPFTFFIYKPAGTARPVLKVENEAMRTYLKSALPGTPSEADVDQFLPEFNGVIYAEGNIRVRGLLASKASIAALPGGVRGPGSGDWHTCNPPAVTLVSGNNVYVEGSLVRESPDSMIGLFATDYVTVNTTLFVPPVAGDNLAYVSSYQNGQPPYNTEVTTGQDFKFDFLFGDNPTQYTSSAGGGGTVPINMFVRQGTAPGVTYINMFLNEAAVTAGQSPDYLFGLPGLPTNVYMLSNAQQQGNYFEQRLFQLEPEPNGSTYPFFTTPGVTNRARIALDPNYTSGSGAQAYLFDHAVVAPADVRIEAVMYAQDGSFFVIPGYPLNMMQDDTRNQALSRAATQGYATGTMLRPAGTADAYPFYGEPVDVRITIVGAISENRTASIADQAAWMQLWGWIPTTYGSTGSSPTSTTPMLVPQQHMYVGEVGVNAPDMRTADERSANITRGLRFLYDPALVAPYSGYDANSGIPFRYDNYGRILPPLPRLPVCPGFVFYGEVP